MSLSVWYWLDSSKFKTLVCVFVYIGQCIAISTRTEFRYLKVVVY
jgi:hypothetical protein